MTDPTDDWRQLDPNLEEVLREIAARQESRLLRVTHSPSRLRSALFSTDPPRLSSRTAGLLAAERKLLDTYREEVAYLLRRLCLERLMRMPVAKRLASLHHGGGRRVQLLSEQELRRRLAVQRGDLLAAYPDDVLALTISSASQLPVGRDVRASELALASHRLVPDDLARIYIAQEQVYAGSCCAAVQAFSFLVSRGSSPVLRARAMSWKGAALAKLKAFQGAHAEFLALSEDPCCSPTDVLGVLSMAVQAGDLSSARRASRLVDDRLTGEGGSVDWWVRAVTEDRAAGGWTPSRDSRSVIERLDGVSDGPAAGVLRVFD